MDLITTEVFAGVTVLHLIIGATVLLLIAIGVQSFLNKKDEGDSATVKSTCSACGWTGNLSKYQKKCPRCNGDVLHSG